MAEGESDKAGTFQVAINRRHVGKLPPGDKRWADFNDSFEILTLDADGLAREIGAGHAYTAPHKRKHQKLEGGKKSAYRHSLNFLHAQHLAVDFDTEDDRSTLDALSADPFIARYAAFLHTTASHTPDKPRARAVFILDQPIMTAGDYADAMTALVWKYSGHADSSCKDAARLFFGAPLCTVRMIGHVLPLAVVKQLVGQFHAAMEAERARAPRREFTPSTPQLEEVADALRCIPAHGDYHDDWLRVLMAVHSEFPGGDGVGLCESWSPGYPGEIERKFKSFSASGNTRGKVTIATLFHKAKEHGWSRPRAETNHNGNHNGAAEPAEWLDSEPDAASIGATPATTKAGRAAHITSAKLIEFMTGQGWRFRLNQSDDSVEVNGERINDVYRAQIRTQLRDHGYGRHLGAADDALITEAAKNAYHPVRAYLAGLQYDGGQHIAQLAGYFLDTHGVFGLYLRRWLIGAVARAMTGGQNAVLVLDGPQGIGKSRFARWVCPLPELFVDGPVNPDDKDSALLALRSWVWEVSELGSTTRRADVDALKAFLSREQFTVRAPYGHYELVKPGLVSFIATANNAGGLFVDPTGSRRFWATTIVGIDWGYSAAVDLPQVWAEAYAAYQAGEPWTLAASEMDQARRINDGYEIEDPVEGLLLRLFTLDPHNHNVWKSTTEILTSLCGAGLQGGHSRANAMALAATLKRLGFERDVKGGARGYYGIG